MGDTLERARKNLDFLCVHLNKFLEFSENNAKVLDEISEMMDSEINGISIENGYSLPYELSEKIMAQDRLIQENNIQKHAAFDKCEDRLEELKAQCRQIARYNNNWNLEKYRELWIARLKNAKVLRVLGGRRRKTKRNPKYKKLKIK